MSVNWILWLLLPFHKLYVRAMVDYNPHVDPSIPCADAGMAFRKGDILEIVDQSDTLWWQAVKLPSVSACAGLIPSTNLLKRSVLSSQGLKFGDWIFTHQHSPWFDEIWQLIWMWFEITLIITAVPNFKSQIRLCVCVFVGSRKSSGGLSLIILTLAAKPVSKLYKCCYCFICAFIQDV